MSDRNRNVQGLEQAPSRAEGSFLDFSPSTAAKENEEKPSTSHGVGQVNESFGKTNI